MKKIISLLLLIFLLWTTDYGLPTANAAVPHLLNYQGRLTDTSGKPLDGLYNITFRLYDAETAGNLLWQGTYNSVSISKGVFSILLGDVNDSGFNFVALAFDKPYWLEIKVGDDVLSPRQLTASAGYAIRAEIAEWANNANTVSNTGISATPAPNKLLPLDNNAKLLPSVLKFYDSGWVTAPSGNSDITLTHNLGTTKVMYSLYGATSNSGDHMGQFWSNDGLGVCVMTDLTPTTIKVRAGGNGAQILWDGSNWGTATHVRIIMLAFE